MKSLLFTMSLSGTVVFLLYIIFRPFLERFCSAGWRYGILKLSLFFFLFPVPWFKYILLDVVEFFCPIVRSGLNGTTQPIKTSYDVVITKTSVLLSDDTRIILNISLILLTIAIVGISIQLLKSRKLQRTFEQYVVKDAIEQKKKDIRELIPDEMVSSEKIRFCESRYIKAPMVMGLFHPSVLVPEKLDEKFDAESLRMIMRHELLHIKHKDLWFKILGIAAISLHWYNPASWLLFYEICCVSELYCDEAVVRPLDSQLRKEYGKLVITASTENGFEDKPNHSLYATVSMLGGSKNIIKRRIKSIKSKSRKRGGTLSWIISCLSAAFICLSATFTTFAYKPAVILDTTLTSDDDESYFNDVEIWSYAEGTSGLYEKALPYNFYFTDAQGNITRIDEEGEGQYTCIHNFVPGTETRHEKNDESGCVTKYYDAERCSKCGYINRTRRTNRETHTLCTHRMVGAQ